MFNKRQCRSRAPSSRRHANCTLASSRDLVKKRQSIQGHGLQARAVGAGTHAQMLPRAPIHHREAAHALYAHEFTHPTHANFCHSALPPLRSKRKQGEGGRCQGVCHAQKTPSGRPPVPPSCCRVHLVSGYEGVVVAFFPVSPAKRPAKTACDFAWRVAAGKRHGAKSLGIQNFEGIPRKSCCLPHCILDGSPLACAAPSQTAQPAASTSIICSTERQRTTILSSSGLLWCTATLQKLRLRARPAEKT